MKIFIVLTVYTLFIGAYGASIADVYDGPIYDLGDDIGRDPDLIPQSLGSRVDSNSQEYDDEVGPVRARRLTCDVFSFQSHWVTPNHSACAIKCIAQRRRGGRCQNGICVCRRGRWGK